MCGGRGGAGARRACQGEPREGSGDGVRVRGALLPWNSMANGEAMHTARRSARWAAITVLTVGLCATGDAHALSTEQIVSAVQRHYRRTTDFEADFRQLDTDVASNTTTERSGRVQMLAPGAMRFEYTAPRGALVVSDGTSFWTYSPAQRRATLTPVALSPFSALRFMAGAEDLTKDYRATLRHTSARGYEGLLMVELVPRVARGAFVRVLLFVEPTSFRVPEIGIIDAQSNRTRIQFDLATLRTNARPPSSRFQWTPPAGTTVVRAGAAAPTSTMPATSAVAPSAARPRTRRRP